MRPPPKFATCKFFAHQKLEVNKIGSSVTRPLLPCEKQKHQVTKLLFVTKNSKHLVRTSGNNSSALIQFTPL